METILKDKALQATPAGDNTVTTDSAQRAIDMEPPRVGSDTSDQLDPETRIRNMTPTFAMKDVDDEFSGARVRKDEGFHTLGEGKAEVAVTRADTVYNGLCVNCDVRTTCAMTSAETVIWHCEEYV